MHFSTPGNAQPSSTMIDPTNSSQSDTLQVNSPIFEKIIFLFIIQKDIVDLCLLVISQWV